MSKRRRSSSSPLARFAAIAALSSVVLFAAISQHWRGSYYVNWVAALSMITFLFYGYDKFQAMRQGLRVPERLLHAMALLGGFIGGWFGMLLFRHKLRKQAFWAVLAGSTVLHAAIGRFL